MSAPRQQWSHFPSLSRMRSGTSPLPEYALLYLHCQYKQPSTNAERVARRSNSTKENEPPQISTGSKCLFSSKPVGHDGGWVLTIFPQAPVAKHVNSALLDQQVGGAERRLDAERHHQRPGGTAMRHRDGIGPQRGIPVLHPDLHRGVGLAAFRRQRPFG